MSVPDPFKGSGGSEDSLGVSIQDPSDAAAMRQEFKNLVEVSRSCTPRPQEAWSLERSVHGHRAAQGSTDGAEWHMMNTREQLLSGSCVDPLEGMVMLKSVWMRCRTRSSRAAAVGALRAIRQCRPTAAVGAREGAPLCGWARVAMCGRRCGRGCATKTLSPVFFTPCPGATLC